MNAIVRGDVMDVAIHEAEQLFIRAGRAKVAAEAAGASEQMAEADPVYEAACTDWELAAYDAETLKAEAEAKRMKFDAWRTANATERARMNLR
jgi:hypothetical protein